MQYATVQVLCFVRGVSKCTKLGGLKMRDKNGSKYSHWRPLSGSSSDCLITESFRFRLSKPHFAGQFYVIKTIRQSLLEIFQNSAIHSDSASGIFACGQFIFKKQRLDFTIADAGIGIRENVRRYLGDDKISSRDAIRWA
jgi:hypothetical protein